MTTTTEGSWETQALRRALAVLRESAPEAATSSRDFGRGYSHACTLLGDYIDDQTGDR